MKDKDLVFEEHIDHTKINDQSLRTYLNTHYVRIDNPNDVICSACTHKCPSYYARSYDMNMNRRFVIEQYRCASNRLANLLCEDIEYLEQCKHSPRCSTISEHLKVVIAFLEKRGQE